MKLLYKMLVFIIAVITTFLLSSMIGTQIIIADLQGFGVYVSAADRFAATLHDIGGLAQTLPILISVAFLVAFLVAAVGNRFAGGKRLYWYLAAGFTSVPAALMLIKSLLGGTPFAAARTGLGMFLVALCSLCGAWVFARLTQKRTSE